MSLINDIVTFPDITSYSRRLTVIPEPIWTIIKPIISYVVTLTKN